jgi:hypothetical protein
MVFIKKAAFILLVMLLFSPTAIFSQENENTETTIESETIYIDLLFNQYIKLEDSILLDEENLEEELYEIRKFRNKAEAEGRRDIQSRLDMLDFVVKTRIDEKSLTTNSESIIEKILSDEELLIARNGQKEAADMLSAASFGTTIASGIIFLGSSILYEELYSEYIVTQKADQAAFYLFWWQISKTTSIISGWTTAAAALTSGIFGFVL